jgi:hypothetical protein
MLVFKESMRNNVAAKLVNDYATYKTIRLTKLLITSFVT